MLIANRVRLRAVERDDLPRLVAWLNDPELRSHVLHFSPLSLGDEERWFERLGQDASSRVFAIERREADTFIHVGVCGLHDVDLRNGGCTVGIFLGEPAERGRGTGRVAMRLLLDFAFDELRLHRVELEVFEENAPGIAVYEHLGFVAEGQRRESVWKGGRWRSPIVMSLLEGERRAAQAAGRAGG